MGRAAGPYAVFRTGNEVVYPLRRTASHFLALILAGAFELETCLLHAVDELASTAYCSESSTQ